MNRPLYFGALIFASIPVVRFAMLLLELRG